MTTWDRQGMAEEGTHTKHMAHQDLELHDVETKMGERCCCNSVGRESRFQVFTFLKLDKQDSPIPSNLKKSFISLQLILFNCLNRQTCLDKSVMITHRKLPVLFTEGQKF